MYRLERVKLLEHFRSILSTTRLQHIKRLITAYEQAMLVSLCFLTAIEVRCYLMRGSCCHFIRRAS